MIQTFWQGYQNVLDRVIGFLKNISRGQSLFAPRDRSDISKNGICCIELNENSFSIAYARNEKDKTNLILCASYPFTTPEDLQDSLTTLVKYHQLDKVNCIWVLETDNYQLLLTENLPVPANEFQTAIRWKIKDLIKYPIDDATIDSFPLPLKKIATSQDMIMVTVAKTSELKDTSKQLQKAGLHLTEISILELSLKNISSLFDQSDKSIALIYMQEKHSQLIITSKKMLHFNRRIELGINFFDNLDTLSEMEVSQKIDRLALEIQRSFDYYQSQWRQSIPAKIIFSSVKLLPIDITPLLSQRLSIPTELLDLSPIFTNPKVISKEDQGIYLSILGYVINTKGEGYATKD